MSFDNIFSSSDRFTMTGSKKISGILKKSLIAALVVAGSFLQGGSLAQGQVRTGQSPQQGPASKRIETVALVNRQPITRTRLGKLCVERFGKEVLQAMVNKLLVERECERLGIRITSKDIEAELRAQAGNFKISIDQYLKIIAENRGVSADRVRNEIIWLSLALRNIARASIQVTEAEVNQALDREYGRKVLVRVIMVTDKGIASTLLQTVRSKPDSFGKVAKDYSKDPETAPYEGLLRVPYRQGEMPPAIDKAVFALEEGKISDVIQSGNFYYIFQCNKIFPAVKLSPQFRAQNFNLMRDRIREQKLGKAAKTIFRKLQDQAKIQIVVGNKQLSAQYPGVAALVSNQPIRMTELAEECIARSGEQVLNVEIARTILKQEIKRNNITITQSDIHAEIDRAAEEGGHIDRNGNVDRNSWLKRVTENDNSKISSYIEDAVWLTVALRKLVERSVKVTAEDLQKAFVASYGPRVRALAIVCTESRTAEKVWRMARNNPTEENFRKLAETYSAEMSTRYNKGDVPPIGRYSGRPQLEDAAFRLKENEISGIINEGKQWMILYGKGRTTPVVNDIKDVKEILFKRMMERKIIIESEKKMISLHENAEIDNFLSSKVQIGKRALDTFKENQQKKVNR